MRALLLMCLPAWAAATCPVVPAAEAPLQVQASFYPLADFARRIGGEHVAVEIATPADGDPAGWRPDAAAIAKLQAADLVLINGANFEEWPRWVALPFNRTVDTTAQESWRFLSYESAIKHQHGSKGEHDHTGIDGHTWLDLDLAAAQARAIAAALSRSRPDVAPEFECQLERLVSDLADLSTRLAALSPPPLVANHPAYNYLAQRYGWTIASFDLGPEAAPDAETVAKIQASGATLMLWESEPSAAARIPGLRHVVFSPVERAPENGDFTTAMRANVDRLAAALAQ